MSPHRAPRLEGHPATTATPAPANQPAPAPAAGARKAVARRASLSALRLDPHADNRRTP